MIPYKIPGRHFKLGSKAHIEDFIYAQRMFQLSSETSKFAFWIYSEIKRLLLLEAVENKSRNILIIGYEYYSEMLINETINLLENDDVLNAKGHIDTSKFEFKYNLVKGSQEPEFLRDQEFDGYKDFYKDCTFFIVVPIATTLSTSLKIRSFILKNKYLRTNEEDFDEIKELDNRIVKPYFNILLVTGADLENSITYQADTLEYEFNWRSYDYNSQTILVKPIDYYINEIPQKFLTHHKSKWYKSSNCSLCFPSESETSDEDSRLSEKALLTVDKSSIHPEFIIKIPRKFNKPKYFIDQPKHVFIPANSYSYVHKTDLVGRHYIHFIEPNPFYESHKEKVIEWLKLLKTSIPDAECENTVIITPAKQENLYFLDAVNDFVFGNRAKILQYNTEKSFNQNNQLFYEGILKNSSNIYFVDDFIQSGNTFLRISNFVRETGSSIKGLICMLNKTDKYALRTIFDYLPFVKNSNQEADIKNKKFYPFYDVNVQAIRKTNCPMCREKLLYEKLAEESVLDALKITFLEKARKFNVIDITPEQEKERNIEKLSKSILLFLATKQEAFIDEINYQKYSIFLKKYSKILNDGYLKFLTRHFINKYLADLSDLEFNLSRLNSYVKTEIAECIKAQSLPVDELYSGFFDDYLTNTLDLIIIKILTQSDFKNFIKIREDTATEIIKELIELESEIISFLEQEEWENLVSILKGYYFLRQYKFLLRRSVILQLNFILHPRTLENLKIMISEYEGISPIDSKIFGFNRSKRKRTQSEHQKEKIKFQQIVSFEQLCFYFVEEANYNTSLFNYFYASLVKELTHFEPTKSQKLEEILGIVNQKTDKTPNQYSRLIQTIEFENTSIITNAFEEIISLTDIFDFKNIFLDEDNKVEPFSDCAIELLKTVLDIREKKYQKLEHFFHFTKLDQITRSGNTYDNINNDHLYVLRALYLHILMIINPPNFMEVITGITKNINRITCDTHNYEDDVKMFFNRKINRGQKFYQISNEANNFGEKVLTFIKTKNHREETNVSDLKLIYLTTITKEPAEDYIFNHDSLAYQVFSGISKTNYDRSDAIPENTLVSLEISCENSNYKISGNNTGSNLFLKNKAQSTEKVKAFPINKSLNYYSEKVYYHHPLYLNAFKINDINLVDTDINIYPLAVFLLSSFKEFENKRLRYLLSLREPLSKYLKLTFINNAYISLIEEEYQKNAKERDGHSRLKYLETIEILLKISRMDVFPYSFSKNQLSNFIEKMVMFFKRSVSVTEETNTTYIFEESSDNFKSFILLINFAAKLYYYTNSSKDKFFEEINPISIFIPEDLDFNESKVDYLVEGRILFELIFDMYRHNTSENLSTIPNFNSEVKFCKNDSGLDISFSHKYMNSSKSIEETILLNYENTSKRGTDMIANIINPYNEPLDRAFNAFKADNEEYIIFTLSKKL